MLLTETSGRPHFSQHFLLMTWLSTRLDTGAWLSAWSGTGIYAGARGWARLGTGL
jgi:hypothetical protein